MFFPHSSSWAWLLPWLSQKVPLGHPPSPLWLQMPSPSPPPPCQLLFPSALCHLVLPGLRGSVSLAAVAPLRGLHVYKRMVSVSSMAAPLLQAHSRCLMFAECPDPSPGYSAERRPCSCSGHSRGSQSQASSLVPRILPNKAYGTGETRRGWKKSPQVPMPAPAARKPAACVGGQVRTSTDRNSAGPGCQAGPSHAGAGGGWLSPEAPKVQGQQGL